MWSLVLGASAALAMNTLKATTCPKYSCGSSNDFAVNQCIQASSASNEYLIQKCTGSNSICSPTVGFTDAYCQSGIVPRGCIGCLSSGDGYCGTDQNCIGDTTCVQGFCSGASLGEACTNDAYCLPGLFCNLTSATCQTLYNSTQTGCLSDFQCENSAGCNSTAGLEGNCVPYMSVAIGGVVENCDCTSSYSFLCSSLTCSCNSANSTQGTCIPAFVNSAISKPCTPGSLCTGTNSQGAVFKSQCQCGNNDNGDGYCTPMTGDKPSTMYFNLLKTHYSTPNITICNTKSRGQGNCIVEIHGANFAAEFEFLYYFWANYPQLVDNDKCVQAVYNNYYWDLYYELHPNDPDDNDDDDDTALVTAATLFASILVFI